MCGLSEGLFRARSFISATANSPPEVARVSEAQVSLIQHSMQITKTDLFFIIASSQIGVEG